jgi:hypothetical protein
MSELFDAAKNKEWEKLMVRRLLEVLFGTSSVCSASRMALKACYRS